MEERLCVLFDYRNVEGHERKRFGILWAAQHLMELIRRRGPGQHWPTSLIIDELTFLLGNKETRENPVEKDLHDLINRLARNNGVWVTLCHQELGQVNERTAQLLMTLGTQIFGSTSEVEAAEKVAGRFYPYDPHRVKKHDPVYSRDAVIDYRTQEYTRPEQTYLNATKLLDLPKFTFLVATCREEGTMPTSLQRVSIAKVDTGQYMDTARVDAIRARLMERDGRKVDEVLAEIAARGQGSEMTAPAEGTVLAKRPREASGGRRRVAMTEGV